MYVCMYVCIHSMFAKTLLSRRKVTKINTLRRYVYIYILSTFTPLHILKCIIINIQSAKAPSGAKIAGAKVITSATAAGAKSITDLEVPMADMKITAAEAKVPTPVAAGGAGAAGAKAPAKEQAWSKEADYY